MKVKINLTNQTLEYLDSVPYIQGTDSRNKLIVYSPTSVSNIQISYQLQNGRNTIKMSNSGVIETTDEANYISGYYGYVFNAPRALTALTGNFMASIIVTISSSIYKINVMNTVLNSVDFEAFESALEEAQSEFLDELVSISSDIVQLQGNYTDLANNKVDKTTTVNGHALSSNITLTKADIGLGNVDNTSDLNKPISNATQTALDTKVNKSDIVDNLTTNDATKVLSAKQGKVLKDGLDSEISDRELADTTLQNNINAEATARGNADLTLQTAINASGHKITLSIDSDYKLTATLKDKNNTIISTSNVIDLPLESVVVSGSYDAATKKVVLTLENGDTIEFSVADLIDGLQSEITAQNPLSSDLVDDTNATNKFVSAAEKAQITTNQNAIAGIKDGTTIDSFADVESALSDVDTALGGKQDTLSGSTSVDITSNVVSVNDSYVENFFATDLEVATMLSEVFE